MEHKPITFTRGQGVCIVGKGTAATLHRHSTVTRLTKTLIVVALNGPGGTTYESKFSRRDAEQGVPVQSVPYSPYGGATLHATCQRPKTKG